MLVGGLWLWAFYVYVAIAKVHPSQWVLFPVNFVGYGLLSVGFLLWMRARKGTPADRPETPKQEE
jgi:hypothetical protein